MARASMFLVCFASWLGCCFAQRPNFVWLVSEDNSKHFLKLFDEHGVETPRIAKLADEGVVFERAFSNAPVCSVARTTLMTGCYAPRIGTQFHRKETVVPLPGTLRMFPHALARAGYYTANKQKKDYNAIEGEGVWHASSRRATWRDRKAGQPFFFMQSFAQSHESSLHFGRKVFDDEKTVTDPETVYVPDVHPDTELFRYTYARYHDRIRIIDEAVGAVIDELERDGLLDTTFVFYFGDHGGVLPGSKGYLRETGLHVPLVVRVPERFRHLVALETGSRTRAFVSFVDFGPTLLHLAGVAIPDEMDGVPFLGTGIDHERLEARNTTFSYADRFDEKVDLVRAVRRGRFKYVRHYQPWLFDALHNEYRVKMLAWRQWEDLFRRGELDAIQSAFFRPHPPEMLFDVEEDPYETHDLASDPRYAEELRALRSRLGTWSRELPDLSAFPESVLVTDAFEDPTAFGRANRERIARCFDTADLALRRFEDVAEPLRRAIADDDPSVRRWGMEVLTYFGDRAASLVGLVSERIAVESERLVRVLALCFLARLHAHEQAVARILDELASCTSPVEANLILNHLVALRDGPDAIAVSVDPSRLHEDVRAAANVERRLATLARQ